MLGYQIDYVIPTLGQSMIAIWEYASSSFDYRLRIL